MNKKNNSTMSREAVERRRHSIIAYNDVSAQDDTDADAEFLDGVLSQLRTVRVPGREKLTLDEAIEAAHLQYVLFHNWLESGKPIGAIKGWVDGKQQFIVRQDLREITFGVPPSDDAVLQITTQLDDDEIVLYNLRLQDVPAEGMTHTEYWSNGQHMSFTIVRQQHQVAAQGSTSVSSQAQFCVNITVNAEPSEAKLLAKNFAFESGEVVESLREDDYDSTGDINKYRKLHSIIDWVQDLMSIRKVQFATVAVAMVLPMAVLLVNNLFLKTDGDIPIVQIPEADSHVAIAEMPANWKTSNEIPNESGSPNSLPVSSSANLVVQNHTRQELATGSVLSIGWKLAALLQTQSLVKESAAASNVRDESQPKNRMVRFDLFAKSAEMNRFATLATLQHVSVRLQDAPATQATENQLLLSSFAQAFEASSRFKVLRDSDNSKADVVIGLRYEGSEPNAGVVFVDIRDSDGKFIWQDFTDCEKPAKTDHWTMFAVAAESLVNNLEKVIVVSKQPQTIGKL
jgi:hypothetical protein